jgi:16S rRNA (guanine(966)-N(2))-methyltransferase RsmD
LRIVAGTAKGRRLTAPRGSATRPTSDKVRAAIFNVLGQFFEGGEVLDLYAGTGAMALEALSRGCTRALCVESDRGAAAAIEKNAEACGFGDRLEVARGKVEETLTHLPAGAFFLVFIDPPYQQGPEGALARVARLLAPRGTVVAEHDRRRPPPERPEGLSRIDLRSFGDTGVSLYSAHG